MIIVNNKFSDSYALLSSCPTFVDADKEIYTCRDMKKNQQRQITFWVCQQQTGSLELCLGAD